VDVVEGEQHRLASAQPVEQVPYSAIGEVTIVRGEGGGRGARLAQRREDRGQLRDPLPRHSLERPRVERGEIVVAGVQKDPERELALELGAAAVEDEPAASIGLNRELVQQPGLADAGLAADREHPDRARLDLFQRALEGLQLAPTSYQGFCRRGHSWSRSA
jgi:hypothetical protein